MAEISIGNQETDACQSVRLKISVSGIVQGVGFRPFIYRLASRDRLTGYVLNNPQGVEIEIEGPLAGVSKFLSSIVNEKPPQARIDSVSARFTDLLNDEEFVIRESSLATRRTVLVSPDIATCLDCLGELRRTTDRRHKYPFINCTNCGPRYTIIRDIPYDRQNTTMNVFRMCPDCLKEYGNPRDRRFHAEPNACWLCGPHVTLRDSAGGAIDCDDPIMAASSALMDGKIVAVKGLGGFHLAVDATDEDAVKRLREKKRREEKPLAIMAESLASVRLFARVSKEEEDILVSPARPIALLEKLPDCRIAESVAPGNRYIGVMLPYTPIHHLLLQTPLLALVMTSGNISEEPIAIDIEDARQRLGSIADLYLDHDREILSRSDDSVVRVSEEDMLFIRRSRGWVPLPISLESGLTGILACGAHLKNTVAITRGNQVFLSQHIGDLENLPAYEFFRSAVSHLAKIIEVKPHIVAHDLHPDYLSTRFALEFPAEKRIRVQHHHAHIASCLGEAGLDGPVIGMALDGTGYGPDGTVWGGEVLIATRKSYKRVGHIETVGMPGGEMAIKQPWRMACSHVHNAFDGNLAGQDLARLVAKDQKQIEIIERMLERGTNCPLTSSCGRLFDAVSSLCGIRDEVKYEGQAAVELEMAMDDGVKDSYPVCLARKGDKIIVGVKQLVKEIVGDIREGVDRGMVSAKFHSWLAESLLSVARTVRDEHGISTVALSGGCFQNIRLLKELKHLLTDAGFETLINVRVPANDGGISFGQAVVASAIIEDRSG